MSHIYSITLADNNRAAINLRYVRLVKLFKPKTLETTTIQIEMGAEKICELFFNTREEALIRYNDIVNRLESIEGSAKEQDTLLY